MNGQTPSARQAEFDDLYRRHSREVWALAYARWLDADAAQDIMQEAFLRLWRHWESVPAPADDILNARAWLLRVGRNLAEDYAKSAFRRNGTQEPQLLDGVLSREESPEAALEKQETFAQIRAVMAELAPADRDILTLRYALDYDAQQIAEVLGVNAAAVHMRLSRARQRLADKLSAHGLADTTHEP